MSDISSQGQNQFLNTPNNFTFNATTTFDWSSAGQTWLTGLFVDGISNTSEKLTLPLWSAQCSNHSTTNACIAWLSNGSASFGGPYADGLKLYNEYRFRLTYVAISNVSETGKQQSSNFVMVDEENQSPPTTTSSANGTTASPTSSGTSTTSRGSATSSLSAGAKAGIGVGAAIGALLVLLGVFFLWRRHRRRRIPLGYNGAPTEDEAKNENKNTNLYERGELDGTMPTTLPAQEMDASVPQQDHPKDRPVSELGGTS